MEPLLQAVGRAVKRGGVFIVGMTLLLAGVAMLVLPGPGIAAIVLGLVVLSAEFKWAQRILTWARHRFAALKQEAQARLPGANRRPPAAPHRPGAVPTGPPSPAGPGSRSGGRPRPPGRG